MKQILIAPIISEKSMILATSGKYCFEVNNQSNKPEIAQAIEKEYKVKVKFVNLSNVIGKVTRFRGKAKGKRRDWKKAVVTLIAGQKIIDFDIKEQK